MTPITIDDYIAAFPPDVQRILQKIRATIRQAVPDAEERISYRMPTFFLDGVVVHFGAFKRHIGLYPPVSGDARLMADVAPYAGDKGNLQFPLDQPMPYDLIDRIARARMAANVRSAASRGSGKMKESP
ncbi:MAG: DUF1801 domain-containing protein [Burkholderiales bacterium]|nr:DUF1801 domain-containing protein [Burkholderiales bacterium]